MCASTAMDYVSSLAESTPARAELVEDAIVWASQNGLVSSCCNAGGNVPGIAACGHMLLPAAVLCSSSSVLTTPLNQPSAGERQQAALPCAQCSLAQSFCTGRPAPPGPCR